MPLKGYWQKGLKMEFRCLLCVFHNLPVVPQLGYRHKGLQIETFLPIDCSRRSYRHKGLMLPTYWQQGFRSSFLFIFYLLFVPLICCWHKASHKSAISCIKYDISRYILKLQALDLLLAQRVLVTPLFVIPP